VTAEIAILNKSAVALAADSAVTIQVAGGQKIYNTVNKLFTLSKFEPIGAMVYGSAEFMAVPWESIIKEHRRSLKNRRYKTLREYADGFLEWLASADLLFPPSTQEQIFRANVSGYFQQLKTEVNKRVASLIEKHELVDDAVTRRVVHDLILEERQTFLRPPRLQIADVTFEQNFSSRHAQTIDEVRRSIFQDLPLSHEDAANLVEVLVAYYCRDHFGTGASGLVIAGFGTDDVFPSLVHFAVESLLDAHLKWKEIETARIDHFTNNATIVPIAQREMVDTFLSGMDPTYKQNYSPSTRRHFACFCGGAGWRNSRQCPAKQGTIDHNFNAAISTTHWKF